MAAPDFFFAVKSTIDRLSADIAKELKIKQYVDLDDRVNAAAIEGNLQDAVVWQLAHFKPDPRSPIYDLMFAVGIKTADDPGNYQLTRLVSAMAGVVYVGADIVVRNYSVKTNNPDSLGWLYVTAVQTNEIAYDKNANVRLHEIQAKAVKT